MARRKTKRGTTSVPVIDPFSFRECYFRQYPVVSKEPSLAAAAYSEGGCLTGPAPTLNEDDKQTLVEYFKVLARWRDETRHPSRIEPETNGPGDASKVEDES